MEAWGVFGALVVVSPVAFYTACTGSDCAHKSLQTTNVSDSVQGTRGDCLASQDYTKSPERDYVCHQESRFRTHVRNEKD